MNYRHGFTVDHLSPYSSTPWRVSLPHQCGGWMIAEEQTKDAAIRKLSGFVAEASAALEALETIDEDQHVEYQDGEWWRYDTDGNELPNV